MKGKRKAKLMARRKREKGGHKERKEGKKE